MADPVRSAAGRGSHRTPANRRGRGANGGSLRLLGADIEQRLLAAARIPRRYDHCTLEDFEVHDPSHEAARKAAREWIELWPATRSGLLFVAGAGDGKDPPRRGHRGAS